MLKALPGCTDAAVHHQSTNAIAYVAPATMVERVAMKVGLLYHLKLLVLAKQQLLAEQATTMIMVLLTLSRSLACQVAHAAWIA